MFSTGIISFLGFVFWIIVARTYESNEVGIATTLLASSLLISLLSQAGFDTVFIRFLPKSKRRNAYIDTGLIISGLASFLLASGYFLLIPFFAPKLAEFTYNPLHLVIFVLITLFATWNTLTNATLISFRKTNYVLIIDTIFSTVKVILPFAFIANGPMGILIAVGISQFVNVALSLSVLIIRLNYRPTLKISREVIKECKKYASSIYTANVLKLLPDSLLPLIVISLLSASSAAYFYLAFAVANVIYTIAYAMTQVLLAETSHREDLYGQHMRHGLKMSSAMIVPAIGFVLIAAPWILSIFGHGYSEGATGILRMMALSGLLVMIYSFLNFSFRYTKNYKALLAMASSNTLVVLGFSFVFIHKFGLIGVGYAWIIGSAVAVCVGGAAYYRNHRLTQDKKIITEKPKAILITHFFSTNNKGDAALLSVLVSDLKHTYPKASLSIQTLDSISKECIFDGVPMINSLAYHSFRGSGTKTLNPFHALYVSLLAIVWVFAKQTLHVNLPVPSKYHVILKSFESADVIVPVGGGYLRGQGSKLGSILHTVTLVLPLVIAKLFHKPSLLYSQSFGPFMSKFEEKIVVSILNTCTIGIIAREDISYNLLRTMGVKNIERSIDCGFAFTKGESTFNLRENFKIPPNRKLVGVTAKKYLKGVQHKKYLEELALALDTLITSYDIEVVFIPQVTANDLGADDRRIHKDIYTLMKNKQSTHLLENNLDHYTLKACYDALDIMIGTRFHSVIFALTSHVPSIAIEYEHKTSGIMRDLNLEEWVVMIEDVTSDNICQQFEKMMLRHKSYKKYLQNFMPIYVRKSEDSKQYLKNYIRKYFLTQIKDKM